MSNYLDGIDATVRRIKRVIMSLHDNGWSNGQILDHLARTEDADNITISDVAWAIQSEKGK